MADGYSPNTPLEKQTHDFASLIIACLAPVSREHSPRFLGLGSLTQKY